MMDFLQFLGAMVVAFTLFAGQYAVLFYVPRVEATDRATAQRERLRKDVAALEVTVKKQVEFEERRRLLAAKLVRLDLLLPTAADIDGLRSALQARAKPYGVSVSLAAAGDEVRKDFYSEIPLQLEAEGSYTGTATLVKLVGWTARVSQFGDLRVERVGPKRYRMKAALTAFRYWP